MKENLLQALSIWKAKLARHFALSPCDRDSIDSVPFRFENIIDIAADPARVFDVLAGLVPGAEEEWFPDFRAARWLTPEPHGVGAVREYTLSYARVTERFIVWQPGQHLAFYMAKSSLPITRQLVEDYRLAPTSNGGTRVRWRVGYRPSRLFEPLHAPLRLVFGHTFRKASSQLKSYLEKSAPAT